MPPAAVGVMLWKRLPLVELAIVRVVGVWMVNGMVSPSRDSCILSVRLAQQLVMVFWIRWLTLGSLLARHLRQGERMTADC